MENPSSNEQIEKKIYISNFMWLMFTLTICFFIYILYTNTASEKPQVENSDQLFFIFSALALSNVGLIFLLKKIISPEAYLNKLSFPLSAPDLSKSKLPEDRKQAIAALSPKDAHAEMAMNLIQPSYIISFALSETIAIFGLVYGILTQNPNNGLPLIGLGLIMIIFNKPKKADYYIKLRQDFLIRNP